MRSKSVYTYTQSEVPDLFLSDLHRKGLVKSGTKYSVRCKFERCENGGVAIITVEER